MQVSQERFSSQARESENDRGRFRQLADDVRVFNVRVENALERANRRIEQDLEYARRRQDSLRERMRRAVRLRGSL